MLALSGVGTHRAEHSTWSASGCPVRASGLSSSRRATDQRRRTPRAVARHERARRAAARTCAPACSASKQRRAVEDPLDRCIVRDFEGAQGNRPAYGSPVPPRSRPKGWRPRRLCTGPMNFAVRPESASAESHRAVGASTDVTNPDSQPGHLAGWLRDPRGPVHRGALRPCRPSAARLDVRHPVLARGATGGAADTGGTAGVDDAFAEQHGTGSAPRSWAPTSSARRAGRTTPTGRAGGDRSPRSTRRPSC